MYESRKYNKEYSNYRILLIDHKEITARMNSELLQYLRLEVICVNSSEEALKLYKSSKENYFTIIMASLYLPNINGVLLANMIRSIEKERGYKHSISIYMLISETTQEKENNIPCEANGYLMNPLRKKEVLQVLKSVSKEIDAWSYKKILIVDDDLFISDILLKMLASEKLTCLVANSGKEAIELFKIMNNEISLMILDINLGDILGYDVAQEIRNYEIAKMMPQMPIICISAYSGIKHRDRCNKAGINNLSNLYLVTKPVKKEVLFNTIKPFLY